MKKKIMKIPVDDIESAGKKLLQRYVESVNLISFYSVLYNEPFTFAVRLSANNITYYDSGYSEQDSESSSTISNADFQSAIPQIIQNLESIRVSQKQVLQAWNHKKIKLDQCFQLRLFEQDCEKVYSSRI